MDPITALTALGATARITRLIGRDTITFPLRDRLAKKATPQREGDDPSGFWTWVNELIGCPWCLSVWVAAPVAPAAIECGDTLAYQWGAGFLTLSWLTGLAAQHLDAR
ncbi:DUF1360 domain-containing protein [Streptomyces solisilvae]|uniref:DUF1360 domain-containing protein n=1 Tax=Streptomyces malaysiensis TaxID=92644 RepID=UPI0036A2913B